MINKLLNRKTQNRADITGVQLPIRGFADQPLTGAINISESTALTIPTLWACVSLISDSIGSLPFHSYRSGNLVLPTPKLLEQPDPTKTRMESIAEIVQSLLLDGNAYILLGDRDINGHPQAGIVLNPGSIDIKTSRDGERIYSINQQPINPEDVLHIRGLTAPGDEFGIGVVAAQRRELSIAVANQQMASDLYMSGALPNGVLQSDTELTRDEAQDLKSAFVAAHGGRQRSPAVLSAGIRYQPLSLSPKDLEFIDSRINSAREITTMFRVPAHMVNVPSEGSKTYANVTQDSLNFVRFCLRGWLTRIEQAFSTQLPRGQTAKFQMDALLRGSRKERYDSYAIGITGGWLTVDEVRDLENIATDVATDDLN